VKKSGFCASAFRQVVQKHWIAEAGKSSIFLLAMIAHFLSSNLTKKYQNGFMIVKVIARQSIDISSGTQCVSVLKIGQSKAGLFSHLTYLCFCSTWQNTVGL